MSVSYDYSGKTILVTGSTKGIGYAIANEYAKSGATVLISGRTKEAVDKAIASIAETNKIDLTATPNRFIPAVGDCGTKEGCDAVIDIIKTQCPNGIVDVLVNNIGIFGVIPFDKVTDEEWLKYFNINIMSGVRLSRYCLSKMLEPIDDNGNTILDEKTNEPNPIANNAPTINLDNKNVKRRGGNIVFVSSESGIRIPPHMIHYGTTKSAQIAIARGMAQMCKGISNVRVNSLLPGPTFTEGVEEYLKGYGGNKDNFDLSVAKKDYMDKQEPYSLKGDFLDVKEIANGCLYLTSDAASATTGASFRVEGGLIYHL